jgi:hypothetical protein
MKRVICMTLAMVLLSAVAAVAALADEGGIANKAGTILGKKNFTSKSGEVKIEATGGTTIKCKESTASGSVVATEYAEETIHYKGCKSSEVACSGGKEAKAEELVVLLGLLTRRKSQPEGEELLLVSIREEHFQGGVFTFECGKEKRELRGGYLVAAGASGKFAKVFTFSAQQEKGKQIPLEYETEEEKEKVKATLEVSKAGKFEQAGLSSKEEVTFEEEAEFTKGPEFRVTNTSANKRVKASKELALTFKIKNISGINNNTIEKLEAANMGFEYNMAEAKECGEKVYAINATCTFETKYLKAVNGFLTIFVDDFGGGVATGTMVGQ